MTSRYIDTQIKIGTNNKRVTRSVLYPPIPRSLDDIYVLTTLGDRIDLLAKKYYSDIGYWWIIAEANGIGKGTMVIPQGIQLRIPININKVIQDYNELNK